MSLTKITAHRGYCKREVENTIPAFEAALQLGCERIECDVHFSSDELLVVHHDYVLKTVGGELRPIRELTRVDLPPFVPLLETVLEVAKGRAEVEIELKGCSVRFVDGVIRSVARHAAEQDMEFTSPHPYVLSYFRSRAPDAKLGMFVAPFPEWMPVAVGCRLLLESLELGRIDVAHCPASMITAELVEELWMRGKVLHAANCNSRAELEAAYNLRVNQLSTDEVELALAVRAECVLVR